MITGMEGRYVLVRCTAAGVHAGVLESLQDGAATLTDSRRLWRWYAVDKTISLSGVAVLGITHESTISIPVSRIVLLDPCEIMECTEQAERTIRAAQVARG
ncbi:MAG: hypothetical protein OXQ29_26385 [Rhodospirillaceae bacterium]|nr:hypothetical protein [Rhodospirillaceae bacterium]